MSRIDELLHEHSLYSVRSDGSQMIALDTGQNQSNLEWEILVIREDGSIDNGSSGTSGALTLGTGEKAVLRKVCDAQQLQEFAISHDFVEWRSGIPKTDEQMLTLQDKLQKTEMQYKTADRQLQQEVQERQRLDGQVSMLQSQLQQTTTDLQETKEQKEQSEATNTRLQESLKRRQSSQEKKERASPSADDIRDIAATIAARTPSEAQRIIADQVELSSSFYVEVGQQSRRSFQLSVWLAAAGGCIFLLTVVATVLVTLYRGESTLITIIGSVSTVLTEGLAASNRLYNQASQQFANFQIDLDRINRSSFCYTIASDEALEGQKRQEAIIKIIDDLLNPQK